MAIPPVNLPLRALDATQMTLFAVYREGIFVEERSYDTKPILPHKPALKFYAVEIVRPDYDSATQVREGPVIEEDHVGEVRRHVWTVRAKTAGELDADKERTIDRMGLVALRILFNHENRIRTLEARPLVTAQQFRDFVKAML